MKTIELNGAFGQVPFIQYSHPSHHSHFCCQENQTNLLQPLTRCCRHNKQHDLPSDKRIGTYCNVHSFEVRNIQWRSTSPPFIRIIHSRRKRRFESEGDFECMRFWAGTVRSTLKICSIVDLTVGFSASRSSCSLCTWARTAPPTLLGCNLPMYLPD